MIEASEEKKDVFHELMVEAAEGVDLIHAILEGQNEKTVSKQEIIDTVQEQVCINNIINLYQGFKEKVK